MGAVRETSGRLFGKITAHDELDWVGYYIDRGLYFEKTFDGDEAPDKFQLLSFTEPIDACLPLGLQFGEPACEWTITGTPTQAGTYSFTVQITSQPNNLGQSAGPSGTQRLTITIGTGRSDRLADVGAIFNEHTGTLTVGAFDVNVSALYSVDLTSTGKLIIPAQPNSGANDDGVLRLSFASGPDPCGNGRSCNVTVTDSLGSSVTVTVPAPKY